MAKSLEGLTEDERRALRGSKFAPLPLAQLPSRSQPRLAHPGGPLKTNKAAALAKFLERKLEDPAGLTSIDPDILELAVKNAKDTVNANKTSNSGRTVRHVTSFGNSEDSDEEVKYQFKAEEIHSKKFKEKKKNKKQKKKNRRKKMMDSPDTAIPKKLKKKKKSI